MEALVDSEEQPAVDDSELDNKVENMKAGLAEVPGLWSADWDRCPPVDTGSEGSAEGQDDGAGKYDDNLGAHASGAEFVNVAVVGGALGLDCWKETGYCCDWNDQNWKEGDDSVGCLAIQLHVAVDAVKVW